jgi:translation initiation factor 1
MKQDLVYSTETGDLRKKQKPEKASTPKSVSPIRISLDTKGRRGKTVTLISEIAHNPQVIADLCKQLKAECGAGGTIDGRNILIQGDHREKVTLRLKELGYKVR